jgi:N-methylhydantoinase A
MVAGGGAGGIHAAAIARQLSIPLVIVPRVAALMSAFGMFAKELGLEYARSCFRTQSQLDFEEVAGLYRDMEREARADFERLGIPAAQMSFQRSVEMRYVGQFHEIEVDLPAEDLDSGNLPVLLENFHTKYGKMYTYSMSWRAAEFHTFRLKVTAIRQAVKLAPNARASSAVESARRGSRLCLFDGVLERVQTPAYDWDRLAPGHAIAGPALIDDKTTTVLVPPGYGCEVDAYGNLLLSAR